ncbi:restriction endonuclease subunit S [Streptococcus oralis]|uniref:restriction endonuclease subunit S n=1 Tax=Streptococcus oralis TaxID=1303 RepID=UPI000A1089DC|nr:restriction endonuclease subunit S [Streptococcus oralis]MCY7090181.1 restriction endonuclease subunit S [Streptococcus oralis]ORO84615.1 restriction endonuclease subunit S [Streptococcus oralis subsp. dentisani]
MINRDIPKIRFYSYQGAWVENRIADVVKISAGGDVDKVRLKESGKYPVIANALTNKGIVGFYDDYKVKAPAVTVTGRGDVGYAVARHENFTPIVRLLTLQSEDIDVDYLENQINSMRILNESTGVPQLTAPQLGNYKVYHPEIEEQSAIGSLFRTLDDLLSSYKDNLANYQSLKETMLSKMFPKAGQSVPEIRLDGFEGEWKEVQLSDICKKVIEKNKDNDFNETFTNSAEFGIINQRDFFDRDISNEKSLNTYYVVRNNDFVYNPRISNYAPVGPVKRNKLGRTGVMSPLYFVFRVVNSNIDLDFLETFFDTNIWHKFMKLNGDSGARADRFAIKDSIFLKMPIVFPSITEQQAIGAYFSNLDNLINSHQEKISQLETLKKKLLQDMFI